MLCVPVHFFFTAAHVHLVLLAISIYHFLTTAIKFSRFSNEIGLHCLLFLAIAVFLFSRLM